MMCMHTQIATVISENVAEGRRAFQSSITHSGVPDRAVDGNTDGNWNSHSCTHTAKEENPWWL